MPASHLLRLLLGSVFFAATLLPATTSHAFICCQFQTSCSEIPPLTEEACVAGNGAIVVGDECNVATGDCFTPITPQPTPSLYGWAPALLGSALALAGLLALALRKRPGA